MRVTDGELLCVHAAADRERAVVRDAKRPSFDLFANSLFDGLTAFVAAPASETTRRTLGRADAVADQRLRLL